MKANHEDFNHEDFDRTLDRLVHSTRSPRGRFSAGNSWKILEKRLFKRPRILRFRVASAAAAVILLCLTSWFAYNALHMPMETLSTLAETRIVELPDQTRVVLNHYSSLTFPKRFKKKHREVKLQGEAYFEVAKDPAHPFIVQAEAVSVQVLGTHFNVEAYTHDAEVRTTLLEGAVAVSIAAEKQRLVLAPNESAIYNKVKGTLTHQMTPEANNEVLWSRGILFFDREPLHEIARRLSNTFHTEIRIEDPALRNYRMTATFHGSEDLTSILDLLKKAGSFTYIQTDNTVIITRKTH